jgi:opacity protein-like surface antigen
MRSFVSIVALLCSLVAIAPAHAQTRSDIDETRPADVEISPFVSLGSDPSSRIGVAIRFAWLSNLSVEAEVGYRRGESDALSATASLLYDLPRLGRAIPYLAAGAGLEEYTTAFVAPGGRVITQSRATFTVNAGGGVRVPVNDAWGIRADARWSNGLAQFAPEHWRVYNGVTFRPRAR